jgi:CubicO group peptidase (beta-lactamase class C family)
MKVSLLMNYPIRIVFSLVACLLATDAYRPAVEATQAEWRAQTRVAIVNGQWQINDAITYRGAKAEGLLMNVRMVNAVFEDANDQTRPRGFDPDANTAAFIEKIPDYAASGVRAFTLNFQGGMPNYEGAINSAFNPDGSLRDGYLKRVRRVIEACDRHGVVIILGCYYQMQDQILRDEAAVRAGVANAARWIRTNGFTNVALEIANEYGHKGFDHTLLKTDEGQVELIRLAKKTAPYLLVSTSGLGNGRLPDAVATASDFLLPHFNTTLLEEIPQRIAALKRFGKPVVCNEDDKAGAQIVQAAELCVASGVSWGLMLKEVNQFYPFTYKGAADEPAVYAALKRLTSGRLKTASSYFPPPESQGGWRKLDNPEDIRRLAGMDPDKLAELKEWLLESDKRNFAAVVIRNGYVALEVERDQSGKTDTGNIKSCAKAICATALAIASEQSRRGLTPKRMKFDDPAFQFISWAQPLSDPRKARITVKQLLNHTSGITPEALKPRSDDRWEKILGHTDDETAAKLAFDPGTASGYSTHALYHASLVCETVTGKPYDQFAIEALFKPIGIENWWFQFFDGGEKIGRHPSHGLGLPAREMARIAYCMLNGGRWQDTQIIPKWFVDETAAPTHNVKTLEMRFKKNPQVFSHGWELPALLAGEGLDIPADARYKPGSGGQLMAFVPSLELVIARQTGASGQWEYEEYLRRACRAALPEK